MGKSIFRWPVAWAALASVVVAAALGLSWFQPWKLFTDTYVDEALPGAGTTSAVPAPTTATPASATPAPTTLAPAPASKATPAANEILAAGTFVTHEHQTTGSAEIHRLANGRHQLVLRDLKTSNGPDLRVWLTDQQVIRGTAGWRVFDDGEWVELARLKGNRGNQVYDLPASVDPGDFRSVSIWCKRFSVSFGAAELKST
ncbi:DM13 domain-containing protein [Micromonospora sp. NPDC005203]|uniref:DM13 domain-containing protein n=1 Tax=Micromonospora sp. NPDC005203 TaxID=3364226 RepID=UPI0036B630F3